MSIRKQRKPEVGAQYMKCFNFLFITSHIIHLVYGKGMGETLSSPNVPKPAGKVKALAPKRQFNLESDVYRGITNKVPPAVFAAKKKTAR